MTCSRKRRVSVKTPAEVQKVLTETMKAVRTAIGRQDYMLECKIERLHNLSYYMGYSHGYNDRGGDLMAQCRDCGARINFISTENGAWMPVEEDSVDPLELEPEDLVISEDGNTCRAENAQPYNVYYLPHFAICHKNRSNLSEF